MEPRNLNETARICFACGREVMGNHDHGAWVKTMPLAVIPPEARFGGFEELEEDA